MVLCFLLVVASSQINSQTLDTCSSTVLGTTAIFSGSGPITTECYPTDRSSVTNVLINEGLTEIRGMFLSGYAALIEIELSSTVAIISYGALSYCSTVRSITGGTGLVDVDSDAFSNCPQLETVYLPDSLTWIGDGAFRNCRMLRLAKLPESLVSVPRQLLSGCNAITELELGPSLVSFAGDWQPPNLTRISVSPSNPILRSDSQGLVWADNGTTLVACPAKMADPTLTLPSHGVEISGYAFPRQSNLQTISLPAVAMIDSYAFSQSPDAKQIEFGNSLRVLADWAFFYCPNFEFREGLPDSLVEIGREALSSCLSITFVTLGASCSVVHARAFPAQATISISEKNSQLQVLDGHMVYAKQRTELIYVSAGWLPSVVDLLSSVRVVRLEVFSSCSMTQINMPGVTDIGENAFSTCSSLISVSMPSIVCVGPYGFIRCSQLQTVEFSTDLAIIDDNAFSSCYALKLTSLPDSLSYLGTNVFSWSSGLTEFAITAPLEALLEHTFSGCSNLRSIDLPDTMTTIGQGAFSSCSSLEAVSLPAFLRTLEDYAFSYCSALRVFRLPDSIEKCGLEALPTHLYTLSVPATVVFDATTIDIGDELTLVHVRGIPSGALCALFTERFPTVNITASGLSNSPPAAICDREFEIVPDSVRTAAPYRSIRPSRTPTITRAAVLPTRSDYKAPGPNDSKEEGLSGGAIAAISVGAVVVVTAAVVVVWLCVSRGTLGDRIKSHEVVTI
jgi:hypothetical protein